MQASSLKKEIVTFLGVMLCCILWGSAFPGIKIGYSLWNIAADDTWRIIRFAGIRFFLAGILVILIGSLMKKKFLFPKKNEWGGKDSFSKSFPNHRTVCFLLCRSGTYNRSQFRYCRFLNCLLCNHNCLFFLPYGTSYRTENLGVHPWTFGHHLNQYLIGRFFFPSARRRSYCSVGTLLWRILQHDKKICCESRYSAVQRLSICTRRSYHDNYRTNRYFNF